MKKEYKSTVKRLADYFEESRDVWKARTQKYQKEKRALLIQIRDLRRSKENWKTKSKELKIQIDESKKKLQIIQEIKQLIAPL